MDIAEALASDLAVLSEALDQPGENLELLLRGLAEDIGLAVPSYLGLTMTVIVVGHPEHPVTFTVLAHDDSVAAIGTSMVLPLQALTRRAVPAGSAIVFYAAAPGAFVDLAADICFVLDVAPGSITLDTHLRPLDRRSGISGWEEISEINQAIGVLVARGATPETARRDLERRARVDGSSSHRVAQEILRALPGSRSPGS